MKHMTKLQLLLITAPLVLALFSFFVLATDRDGACGPQLKIHHRHMRYLRREVSVDDNGVCDICNTDTDRLHHLLDRSPPHETAHVPHLIQDRAAGSGFLLCDPREPWGLAHD